MLKEVFNMGFFDPSLILYVMWSQILHGLRKNKYGELTLFSEKFQLALQLIVIGHSYLFYLIERQLDMADLCKVSF
jgi:hypothetical protein